MFAWLSANLINIVLIAVIALVVGLLIRGMIRDKKAGKRSCGGNCACCASCSGCGNCCSMKDTATKDRSGRIRISPSKNIESLTLKQKEMS